MQRFRFSARRPAAFDAGHSHQQSIGRLPVSALSAATDELEIIPSPRRFQLHDIRHFVYLDNVIPCVYRA